MCVALPSNDLSHVLVCFALTVKMVEKAARTNHVREESGGLMRIADSGNARGLADNIHEAEHEAINRISPR